MKRLKELSCLTNCWYVQLIVRVNGGIHKSQMENVIEFNDSEKPSLRQIKKDTCKRFGCKEKAANCVIYSKKGIQLFDEDINFIQPNDILYIALDGKDFLSRFAGGRTRTARDILLLS